jgi:hypothetical protein
VKFFQTLAVLPLNLYLVPVLKRETAHLSHEPEMMTPAGSTWRAQTLSVCPTKEYSGSSLLDELSTKMLITMSCPPTTAYPEQTSLRVFITMSLLDRDGENPNLVVHPRLGGDTPLH